MFSTVLARSSAPRRDASASARAAVLGRDDVAVRGVERADDALRVGAGRDRVVEPLEPLLGFVEPPPGVFDLALGGPDVEMLVSYWAAPEDVLPDLRLRVHLSPQASDRITA